MSLFTYLQGSLVATSSIRLRANGYPGPQMTAAADGSGSQGAITFDDPTGSLTVTGWQSVTVDEPECTSAPRLFTGYVAERTYRRGPYRVGAGREIETTVNDLNALLSLRLIVNSDGKRPRETETQRFAWLFASPYLNGLVEDLGFVDDSSIFYCDEADYRDQKPYDVIAEMAQTRGLIFFVYYDQTLHRNGLFFDDPTASTYTSTLTLSNDLSDVTRDVNGTVTGTCYPVDIDPEMNVTPEDVVSRIKFNFHNGYVIRNNLTTAASFFPSPLVTRGLSVTDERVGLLSTATTFADRLLARYSTEYETITCTVRLPASKVGLIDAGMRISVRFTHLPGFSSFAWTRVERKSILQTEGDNTQYDVTLTLSTRGLTGAPGTGGGSTDVFPLPPAAPGTLVQYKTDTGEVTMDQVPADGDLMLAWITERATFTYPTVPTGWTSVATAKDTSVFGDNFYGRLVSKTASGESQVQMPGRSSNYMSTIMEFSGVTLGASVSQSDLNSSAFTAGGAITPAAGNAIVVGCGVLWTFYVGGAAPDTGVTEIAEFAFTGSTAPSNWVGYKTVSSAASTTVGATLTGTVGRLEWGGVTVVLETVSGGNPPTPGKWVYNEVPTPPPGGGNRLFYTVHPYSPLSLKVWVDQVEQTAAVTETNPATGAFTLAFDPRSWEVITVSYQGI